MRRLLHGLVACLLLGWVAGGAAFARTFQGVVSHVTDGDSLWVRPPGEAPVQVRLQGIDAPEICQPFGPQARHALAARARGRTVRVSTRATDAYQRSVGRVTLRGEDLGASLVAAGYAWSSNYRNRPGPYALEEAQARQAGRGLWAAPAVEPRLFRKRHGACPRG